ncbi:ATP-dependent helicase [Nonomuraea indica]|uniref:DNA 3'-5' helicase n=1 Tax=Nonomuraea indica TaxID=1581193 RepID=A0ABW7ZVX4_9ACTN
MLAESGQRPTLLPPTVADEIKSLNDAQRRAVLAKSHTVVLAGPGAGKTRILVAKAAYLATTEVTDPQRVACVTFATKAAEEIRQRLRALYAIADRIVSCATVHSFCLHEILIPFASIAGYPPVSPRSVIDEDDQFTMRVRAYREAGLYEDPRYSEFRDIACRRAIFAGESADRFGPQAVMAARIYDDLLMQAGVLDFEAMVGRSLQILRERPMVRHLIKTRFPWLVIDEYQDLGPVMHGIVAVLRDTGTHIFAVGDPDQSIHGFTGSDPRYLVALAEDPQFHVEPLKINYRSGHVLVDAAAKVLGEDRGYEAHSEHNPGVIDYQIVAGGIREHADHVAKLAASLIYSDVSPHEIGVLYPRNRKKAPIRDWLVSALAKYGLPFHAENSRPWPRGRICGFLQKVASWQLTMKSGMGTKPASSFDELVETYTALRAVSWHHPSERLAARVALWETLAGWDRPEETLSTWVARVDKELNLTELLSRNPEAQELKCLHALQGPKYAEYQLSEFSGDVEVQGKIALTTYHSSKGRQWPYVILPALQEGVVPDWPLDYGRPYPPGRAKVSEERRLFYVALTRAQRTAVLVYSGTLCDTLTHHRSASRFLANLPGVPSIGE